MSQDVGAPPPVRRVAVRPITPPATPPPSRSPWEALRRLHPAFLSGAAGIAAVAVLVAGWQLLARPTGASPVEPIITEARGAVRLADPGVEMIDAGVVRLEDRSATALVLVTVDDVRTSFLVTLRETDDVWRSTGIERAR